MIGPFFLIRFLAPTANITSLFLYMVGDTHLTKVSTNRGVRLSLRDEPDSVASVKHGV